MSHILFLPKTIILYVCVCVCEEVMCVCAYHLMFTHRRAPPVFNVANSDVGVLIISSQKS